MCGIAGFSLNKNSKINARALSHALLASIESRGRMSSGVAYVTENGGFEVYKDAVAGSNLPLKSMPRDTKTAIMHTRYATQGSPKVNENNHPVWSPYQTIALVHNGVIWNDWSVRRDELAGLTMPEVDTAVIPALLEAKGVQGISKLAGDAAVAWLNIADTSVLHLARIESSPVAYTNLEDGSFVFASTGPLLIQALSNMQLEYGEIFHMSELDYYQLRGGVIWEYNEVPQPEGYGRGLAASTRGATSGVGTGFYSGGTKTTDTTPMVLGSTPAEEEDYYDRMDALADKFTEDDEARINAAWTEMSMDAARSLFQSPKPKLQFDHPTNDDGESDDSDDRPAGPRFFTIDTEGNMETYDDLDELETRLLFLAGTTNEENGFGEGPTKWVNYFTDVGSFGFEKEEMISWVEEPSEIAYFDDANTDGLGYVRDGVSLISSMAGR